MPRKSNGHQSTHELLRAFVALSESLNLTETSEELGLTRQTVRRYITHLESLKGAPLFELKKNSYRLTPLGAATQDAAKSVLNLTEKVCSPQSDIREFSHLEVASYIDDQGREFHTQQHPVSTISKTCCPLVQRGFGAWATALMQLEAGEMKSIRPFLVVYRQDPKGWLCVEIGEKSAYTQWFGWTWSKSALGKLSYQDQAGDEFERMVSDAYSKVFSQGGARVDHVFAHLPRETPDQISPVTFQRLLMTCILPDGTPVLAVLVAISNQITITALNSDHTTVVPDDLDMAFN